MSTISVSTHVRSGVDYHPGLPGRREGSANRSRYPGGLPGSHLILDLAGVQAIDELDHLREILVSAALDAGVTILDCFMHHFGEGMGVTGVVVLAESHISIHTWPEEQAACIDIFMCGSKDPRSCIARLVESLKPAMVTITELSRNPVPAESLA